MAKMSELDAALKALMEQSRGIQESVRCIRELMSADAAPEPNETHKPEQAAEPEKTYTLQDVRAMLREKTSQGHKDEVKALLKAHGAERLPDIDPKEYPAMMQEAEEIGA